MPESKYNWKALVIVSLAALLSLLLVVREKSALTATQDATVGNEPLGNSNVSNVEYLKPDSTQLPQEDRKENAFSHFYERWPDAELIATKKSNIGDGKWMRVQLFQVPTLPYPIRREEIVFIGKGQRRETMLKENHHVGNRVLASLGESRANAVRPQLEALGYRLSEQAISKGTYVVYWDSLDIEGVPIALELLNEFGVRFSEPDYIVSIAADSPDDPEFASNELWGMLGTRQSPEGISIDSGASEAWQRRSDASDVIVGVIDSGIRYTHEDLADNMWINPDEIPDNGIDEDSNGYIDDVHGINVIAANGDPMDDNGHGSHTSGTIAAVGDNGVGVVGVAWSAKLMALKFLSERGNGSVSDAIKCIEYARQKGARVLNNSWGGFPFSQALQDAIQGTADDDMIFVLSAGNESSDNDSILRYPSSYTNDNIVAVASLKIDGELSSFSNYGELSVSIAAPGEDILSCWKDDDSSYKVISGTSMAAPHVTGAFVLQIAEYPEDNYREQISRLYLGAGHLDSLRGKTVDSRMLKIDRSLALSKDQFPPLIERTLLQHKLAVAGQSLSYGISVSGSEDVEFAWTKNLTPVAAGNTNQLDFDVAQIADSGAYQVSVSNANGTSVSAGRLEVVEPLTEFSDAVEAEDLSFYLSGNSDWVVQDQYAHVGSTALKSEAIQNGTSNRLSVQIQGPGDLQFYWKVSSEDRYDKLLLLLDGVLMEQISGERDWEFVVIKLAEAKLYTVEWSYQKDAAVSEGLDAGFIDAVSFLASAERPPEISKQPISLVVGPNQDAILSVSAIGEDLLYQWYKDEILLDGETDATLHIEGASASDAGAYWVVVSNEFGSIRSDTANVEVGLIPASIVASPTSQTLAASSKLTLTVGATGTLPLSYVWFKDGEVVEFQDGPEFVFESVQSSNSGTYQVVVYNEQNADGAFSETATITVVDVTLTPEIEEQPISKLVEEGKSVTLKVKASGTPPLNYVWEKGGVPVAGAGNDRLTIPMAVFADSGTYRVVVSNPFGQVVSEEADITVTERIGDALGQPDFEWSQQGDSPWNVDQTISHDGIDSVSSNTLSDSESASIGAICQGPAQLSFWWKTSTDPIGDILEFKIDDAHVSAVSGETDWQRFVCIIPDGTHRIEWTYSKDNYETAGLDSVWVDEVTYTSVSNVELSSAEERMGPSEGSYGIEFETDGYWRIVSSAQWVSLSETEGTGSASIEVTVAANEMEYARYAVLYIGDQIHRVVQRGTEDVAVAEALDYPQTPSIIVGEELWYGQSAENHDGIDAAQTVPLENSQSASLSLDLDGAGLLTFYWTVESEKDYDFLNLILDGQIIESISGDQDWKKQILFIPAGKHTVTWRFEKDYIDEEPVGRDTAWLDEVAFQSLGNTTFSVTEFEVLSDTPYIDIPVVSDGDWQTYNDHEWLNLSQENGSGSSEVRLTIDVNEEASDRFATIYIGNQPIHVKQLGDGRVNLSDSLDLEGIQISEPELNSWFGQTEQTHDGEDAAQSGKIEDWKKSSVFANIRGPVYLGFYWKVSSEPRFDTLSLYVDGVEESEISGLVDWESYSLRLSSGDHRIEWRYRKNASTAENEDAAWLDQVSIAPLSFDAWLALYFDVETIESFEPSAEQADSDGDGWSNRDEYLLGTDPAQFKDQVRLRIESTENELRLRAAPIYSPVNVMIRQSPNLQDWSQVPAENLQEVENGIEVPLVPSSSMFFKLEPTE